jgi:hypothetical protein
LVSEDEAMFTNRCSAYLFLIQMLPQDKGKKLRMSTCYSSGISNSEFQFTQFLGEICMRAQINVKNTAEKLAQVLAVGIQPLEFYSIP